MMVGHESRQQAQQWLEEMEAMMIKTMLEDAHSLQVSIRIAGKHNTDVQRCR